MGPGGRNFLRSDLSRTAVPVGHPSRQVRCHSRPERITGLADWLSLPQTQSSERRWGQPAFKTVAVQSVTDCHVTSCRRRSGSP
jgi:hypothetical protein